MTATVNTEELEAKVKDMYRHVAQQPQDRFHFELGAPVALNAAKYGVKSISLLATKTD